MADKSIKGAVEKRFIRVMKERGWEGNGPYLLGVSGGSDSMALLSLFTALFDKKQIVVAHMDHALRDRSPSDAHFVEECCKHLGVCCIVEKRPVAELSLKNESVEAAGRRLRYEFFEEQRARLGCMWIALGHTRNDLAESVLMNISRGSGLRGLAGIPPQRNKLIRPLLGFMREELRRYLEENDVSWIEDESNDSNIYQRNRVRNLVIPCIVQNVNPQVVRHLADLAEEAYSLRQELDERCQLFLREAVVAECAWPALSLKQLRKLRSGELGELLRYIGRELELESLSRGRTEELQRLIVTSGRWVFQWGSAVDLTAADGVVRWHPAAEKRHQKIELAAGTSGRWGGWRVDVVPVKAGAYSNEKSTATQACPLIALQKNDDRSLFNDPLPRISAQDLSLVRKSRFIWELRSDCEECKILSHVILTPLCGKWRNITWY